VQTDLRVLIGYIVQSILMPAVVARQIMTLSLSRGLLWQALLLMVILGVLTSALTQGAVLRLPLGTATVDVTPLSYALILGGSLVMLVFALHYTGQMLGGTGSFAATLALVVWLEAVAVLVRVAQALLLLALPGFSGIVAILGLCILGWCMLNFVDVLHGFQSLGRAALTLVLAVIGITFGMAIILTLIRVMAPGEI